MWDAKQPPLEEWNSRRQKKSIHKWKKNKKGGNWEKQKQSGDGTNNKGKKTKFIIRIFKPQKKSHKAKESLKYRTHNFFKIKCSKDKLNTNQ